MALGPTLGGLFIRFTGHTLSVFYAAGFTHFLFACLVWFVIPESLSKQKMRWSRDKYAMQEREEGHSVRRLFAFLSPLSAIMPEVKRKGRDWNLTLVAGSYGFAIVLMVSRLFCRDI